LGSSLSSGRLSHGFLVSKDMNPHLIILLTM